MRHGIVATLSRRAALGFVTSIVAVLACTGVASAASYTVNDTTDAPLATSTDTNCVSSQPGGTCTLRAAVQAANNVGGASTITVPAGMFTLSTDTTLDINGNGNGTAITVTGAGSSSTVIDGVDDVSIFTVEQNGGLSLSGLKLQNGYNFDGGAIYSDGALAVTSDVQFVGNDAYTGGAIYSDFDPSSTLSLNGATFTSNAADNSGGAIYYDSPNPASITNTSFNKSSAFGCNGGCDSRFSGDGGAIFADDGGLNIDHSSFSTNVASNGGAIFYSGNSVPISVTNTSFVNNSAADVGSFCGAIFSQGTAGKQPFCGLAGAGGAIYDDSSSATTLTADQFTGNYAFDGGAAYLDSTSYTVNADEFDGNSAKYYGGAIDWENGSLSSGVGTTSGTSFIGNISADRGGPCTWTRVDC